MLDQPKQGKADQSVLNHTKSICPTCLKVIPADVVTDGIGVYIQRTCPEHGPAQGLVWNDLDLYQQARTQSSPNAQLETVSPDSPFYYGLTDQVATRSCLGIFEITQQCNANCPVCIANSSSSDKGSSLTLKQVEWAVDSFKDTVGPKVPIQFSGGEPTVHPAVCDIVSLIRGKGFDNVSMNSNGLLLAGDPDLARRLKDAGMTGVFLQFDGFSSEVYKSIRGKDLLSEKVMAIEHCLEANLSVILQPVIMRSNLPEVWRIIQYAVKAGMAGVDFLPFAASGRHPQQGLSNRERITIPDIMNAIDEQSGGKLKTDDFYSVPCQDQRCAIISYMLIRNGEPVPLTRLVDYAEVKEHYGNLATWEAVLQDLRAKSALCCSSSCCKPAVFDLSAEGYFVVGAHGFQDRWNFDVERAQYCCFHELTAEGTLVPFCWYNIVRGRNGRADEEGHLPV